MSVDRTTEQRIRRIINLSPNDLLHECDMFVDRLVRLDCPHEICLQLRALVYEIIVEYLHDEAEKP